MLTLRSILCPVDFSDQSRHALRWALALAARLQSRVIVFTAIDPLLVEAAKVRLRMDLVKTDTEPALEQFVKTTLPESAAWAPQTAFHVGVGHASELILATAVSEHADLIVMGTHGLGGFRKLLLGSTTERVLRHTNTALLAVPPEKTEGIVLESTGARLELKRILMGTDFSEASATALQYAIDIAQEVGVPLVLSHVVTPVVVPSQWQSYVADVDEERTRYAETRLASLAAHLKGHIECDTVVSIGRPADSLAATAEEREVGLIVLGLMGEEAVGAPRPGSVAYRVVCQAHVPVLVVPPSSTTEGAPPRAPIP
jgi:nucleotide-binding universal stress UspA family protein